MKFKHGQPWKTVQCDNILGPLHSVLSPFAHTIIHDINQTITFAIEFWCKSRRHWCVSVQKGPGATFMDPMFTEEFEEDKVVEQQFVEA